MESQQNENNVGKWDGWYNNLPTEPGSFQYGNTLTYKLASDFLQDCKDVEDWGVGGGGFLRYRPDAIGVDGSNTPFAQKKYIDLRKYTSNVEGIHIRHVFEHNYNWKDILENAVKSATTKLAITMFIPLTNDVSKELTHNAVHGVDVPDMAINEQEFMEIIMKGNPEKIYRAKFDTDTSYKTEEVIFVTFPKRSVHIVTADFGNPNASSIIDIVPQDTKYNVSTKAYTDTDSYSRELALHPRLKGKIPKMLEWMNVDADYYIWMDSNFKITSPHFVNEMISTLSGHDMCLHKHNLRSSILEEGLYVQSNINEGYLASRYKGEPIMDQVNSYLADTSFTDSNLFNLGFFIFSKNVVENKDNNIMKDWFFHNCYWTVQDQLSFPYLLQKHKINYTTFAYDVFSNPYAPYIFK